MKKQFDQKEMQKWASAVHHYIGNIGDFLKYGIPLSYVDAHKPSFFADILISYFLGLSPGQVHEEMVTFFNDEWGEYDVEFISVTNQAVVFQELPEEGMLELPIHKVGKDLKEEARLWEKLRDNHYFFKPSIIKGNHLEAIVFGAERLPTLRWIIETGKRGGFPLRTLELASSLFVELDELRELEIYHRDIRPENVLVYQNRGLIIDFGIATDNPDAIPYHNRRYGGTDLMSLGQLMYKIERGKNLFNVYRMPSLEAADSIERMRRRFCDDAGFRSKYLNMVLDNVHDPEVAKGIEICVMAGIRLGGKPLSCPQEVRDNAYAEVRQFFEGHDI